VPIAVIIQCVGRHIYAQERKPMYKTKLELALEVAVATHLAQNRKGTAIPYIVHPVTVMLIASEVTQDENTLCACLLHDVLESGDADLYGELEMTGDFGPEVTAIVSAVSKDETITDWRKRNEAYLKNLKAAENPAAFIVCAADKIHNLRSILADYKEIGDSLWGRFHAGKDEQKWWYRTSLNLMKSKIPDNKLVVELADLVGQLEAL
jgi:(p)ppGpp synthase/HD superfamily hydrolase